MAIYQQRIRELEERHAEVLRENDELKQLCLYLDEQRQRYAVYRAEDDRESEDLGRYTFFMLKYFVIMVSKSSFTLQYSNSLASPFFNNYSRANWLPC